MRTPELVIGKEQAATVGANPTLAFRFAVTLQHPDRDGFGDLDEVCRTFGGLVEKRIVAPTLPARHHAELLTTAQGLEVLCRREDIAGQVKLVSAITDEGRMMAHPLDGARMPTGETVTVPTQVRRATFPVTGIY